MGVLKDKIGLVTGGGMGIGRAICEAYAEAGASVAVADFNPEAGEETVALIKQAGGNAIFIEADVSDDVLEILWVVPEGVLLEDHTRSLVHLAVSHENLPPSVVTSAAWCPEASFAVESWFVPAGTPGALGAEAGAKVHDCFLAWHCNGVIALLFLG